MHWIATFAAAGLALTGCAFPKVALGASVSLGRSAAQDTAAHTRVRSALWIAMIYTPRAPERDVEAAGADSETSATSSTPCVFEPACVFERDAIKPSKKEHANHEHPSSLHVPGPMAAGRAEHRAADLDQRR